MGRLKGKRVVRREQNSRVINEATTVSETANLSTLIFRLELLTTRNIELGQINTEIEDHVSDKVLVAEYTAVVKYDDEAMGIIAVLGSKTSTLQQGQMQPSTPPTTNQPGR